MASEMTTQSGCCAEREWVDPQDVCTLSPDELAERIEWIRQKIVPQTLGRERLTDGVAIEFVDTPGMSETIDQWIELERVCCSEIPWNRRPSETSGQIRLEIRGVNPDGEFFSSLPLLRDVSQPNEKLPKLPSRFGRLLKAGGFGATVSYFVCCVLPFGLVTVLKVTVLAAPLAMLDDPVWITLGAIVSGSLAWFWMGRRRSAR